MSSAILILLILIINVMAGKSESTQVSLADFPKIMLWAWERPEDLRFIDPKKVGVAFLAKSFYLRDISFFSYPRLQSLRLPPETFIMAVVRIDSDRFLPPALSPDQITKLASEIAEIANKTGVSAIQIDFDAKVSERSFYKALLIDIRSRIPDSMPLSITALASWCIYDNWISDLPIDEAVPMLFRMGVDKRQILQYLASGGDFHLPVCKNSLGISTDEQPSKIPSGRRIYIFHPGKWSLKSFQDIMKEVQK